MKKNVLKSIILMIFFGLTIWMLSNSVDAAYISISSAKSTGNPGESITLNISSDCVGRVNLSSTNGTLSANKVWIEGATQSVTVTIGASGTTTVTATAEGGKMSSNGTDVDVPPASKQISITNTSSSENSGTNTNTGDSSSSGGTTTTTSTTPTPTEKSNVATLSNLGITPNDFSGFTPSKTSYSVTVPNEVESVQVYANKGQSGQTVSGTGTKKLEEGANTVNVTVTAEDGKTTKTYTINITREKEEQEDKEEEEENTEEPVKETFGLTELNIQNIELQPQFQTDVYEYKIDLSEDIDKLDITTLATEANANIEITGNENLQEGENIITIILKSDNEEKTAAYQIIVNKKVANKQENQETPNQEENEMQEEIIIIAGIGGAILLIIIIIVIVKVKKSKEKNDTYIPYGNMIDDYDEDNEEEFYEEEPKKKKCSKGKRYK